MKRIVWLTGLVVSSFLASSSFAARPPKKRAVRIDSLPPGAAVHLDDDATKPIGVTPIRSAKIEYGYHVLTFSKEGYRTEKLQLEVDGRTKAQKVTLLQLGKLSIRAVTQDAEGAEIRIDGVVHGTIPNEIWTEPGRHLLTITKTGFKPLEQWMQVDGGALIQMPTVLVAESKPMGLVFVTSDIPGAEVMVDGQKRGVTPLTLDLAPGPVMVEVKAPNVAPFSRVVEVRAGEKSIVEARIRPDAVPNGSALIVSKIPRAEVWIDGARTGTVPCTRDDLRPGSHTVEVRAPGYEPAQGVLQIKAGEQTVLSLDPTPIQAEYGRLSVRASVPGALIFVDGGAVGAAPVEIEKIGVGTHTIVARAPGHEEFKGECVVRRGELCTLNVALTPFARVRVESNARNSRLSIDKQEMGPLPYEGSVRVGAHSIRIEAPDHEALEEAVTFEPSDQVRLLRFDLRSSGTSTTDVVRRQRLETYDVEQRSEGAGTNTGMPLAPGQNIVDILVGAPHIVEFRGMTGLLPGIGVGVGFRLLERDFTIAATELVLRGHLGFRPLPAISAGVIFEGWAGSNFNNSYTFGATARGVGTVHFADRAAISLVASGEMFRDNWDQGVEVNNKIGKTLETGFRMMIGVGALFWATEDLGLNFNLDYRVAGSDRDLLQRLLFRAFDFEPHLSMRGGASFRF